MRVTSLPLALIAAVTAAGTSATAQTTVPIPAVADSADYAKILSGAYSADEPGGAAPVAAGGEIVYLSATGMADLERMTTPFTLSDGEATGYGYGLGIGDIGGRPAIRHGGGIFGSSPTRSTCLTPTCSWRCSRTRPAARSTPAWSPPSSRHWPSAIRPRNSSGSRWT